MPELSAIDQCQPNEDLIEALEELLGVAKSGRMQSFAYVGVYENHSTLSGFSGIQNSRRRVHVIGELYVLATQLSNTEGESYQ